VSNEITYRQPEPTPAEKLPRNKLTSKKVSGSPSKGKIAETIGGGEDAKNSFIWVTIRWSFLIGAITTLAIYLRPIYCQAELQGNLLDDIKAAWSIFMPVITLALGYSFGKGK
jgi:hypothetical protein